MRVYLTRRKILARVWRLALVKVRLLALYKGWKVRQCMKEPSVKALIKEIQTAKKRIVECKSLKQNNSKEQMKKKIKTDIANLIQQLSASMKTSSV